MGLRAAGNPTFSRGGRHPVVHAGPGPPGPTDPAGLYADLTINHMEGPTSFPNLLSPAVETRHRPGISSRMRYGSGTGRRFFLQHCQNEKALLKYQGAEIHVLLLDELTHFTDSMYRFLRGRCRVTNLKIPPGLEGFFPRVMAGSNPGSLGHHWVKQSFVDHGPMRIWPTERTEGGMRRQYIPARLEDNPTLLLNDPTYVDRLEGLGDPVLVRAMREGDWDGCRGRDVW